MFSSRIESDVDAVEGATIDGEGQTPELARHSLSPPGFLKRLLPRTMFGRSLLIAVMPLILVQIIATWVFYDRHWETVSRRLSAGVAGDVAMLIETMKLADSQTEFDELLQRASAITDLDFSFRPGGSLSPPAQNSGTLLEDQLRFYMGERVMLPYRIDAVSEPRDVLIEVKLPHGVLAVDAPRKRLYTSTTYIFILWMLGSSLVLLAVATLFLRNQVKSLRRLAAAADAFGKGRNVSFFKVEGAVEIRQAAIAFLKMRDRIQRQIRQRTEMLAGVSHDLRTPLTRMKLALELLGDDPSAAELKSDVAEMELMVQGYLDFMRGEGSENPVETDISLLLEDVAVALRRGGTPLSVALPPEYVLPVRPNALKRCLTNLIGNARRHSSHVWLSGMPAGDGIDILVDDDGPGIPAEERDRVFRPFVRLDPSRSRTTGGIGLGLTIARDVARGHGGDILLETSPQGGLRARLHLPR